MLGASDNPYPYDDTPKTNAFERAARRLDVAVGLLDAPEGARAEDWLVWCTSRLSFREDAVGRADSLADGVEKGLREFEERVSLQPAV